MTSSGRPRDSPTGRARRPLEGCAGRANKRPAVRGGRDGTDRRHARRGEHGAAASVGECRGRTGGLRPEGGAGDD
jgi:hypothetical protein